MRALVEELHAAHLAGMRAAMADEGHEVVEQLTAVLEARFSRFVALTASSPNAAELYDVHDRVCGDIAAAAHSEATRLVEQFVAGLVAEGRMSLERSQLSVQDAAAVLNLCAEAAKGESRNASPQEFHASLERTVRLAFHGLEPR